MVYLGKSVMAETALISVKSERAVYIMTLEFDWGDIRPADGSRVKVFQSPQCMAMISTSTFIFLKHKSISVNYLVMPTYLNC